MPRKPRIEYEGAFYHVITRGNQRQKIFKEASDYQKYLQLLTVYKNRYKCFLYAYVLMSNHVHLLIETQSIPLSKILQGINQSYTMHFNKKYRTVGHLFQGRYKAILCDQDNYLLALLKYIHQNPLRAKIAQNLKEYAWSSHHAYDGSKNPLGLVDTDPVLQLFSENKSRARRRYREFMSDGVVLKKEEVYTTIDQRLQGDEAFVDRVLEKYDGEITRERRKKEHTLKEIVQAVEQGCGVTLDDLRAAGKSRDVMHGRRVFSALARAYGHAGTEIAAYLSKEPSSVTKYIHGDDARQEIEQLMKILKVAKNGNIQV